jgi:hypothetical protein
MSLLCYIAKHFFYISPTFVAWGRAVTQTYALTAGKVS